MRHRLSPEHEGFGLGSLPWVESGRKALAARTSRLSGLVPGDIAAAARRLRLVSDGPMAEEVLHALEEECAYRDGHRRPIGFVH